MWLCLWGWYTYDVYLHGQLSSVGSWKCVGNYTYIFLYYNIATKMLLSYGTYINVCDNVFFGLNKWYKKEHFKATGRYYLLKSNRYIVCDSLEGVTGWSVLQCEPAECGSRFLCGLLQHAYGCIAAYNASCSLVSLPYHLVPSTNQHLHISLLQTSSLLLTLSSLTLSHLLAKANPLKSRRHFTPTGEISHQQTTFHN